MGDDELRHAFGSCIENFLKNKRPPLHLTLFEHQFESVPELQPMGGQVALLVRLGLLTRLKGATSAKMSVHRSVHARLGERRSARLRAPSVPAGVTATPVVVQPLPAVAPPQNPPMVVPPQAMRVPPPPSALSHT